MFAIYLVFNFIAEVMHRKVYPTKIIIEPYSCVNISIKLDSIPDDIDISLNRMDGRFLARLDKPYFGREDIAAFYHKYVFDVGFNWIWLCEVDHFIESNIVCFQIFYKTNSKKYCSETIVLAICEFTENCTNIVSISTGRILPPEFFIDSLIDRVSSFRLKILDGVEIKKMSLCNYDKLCEQFNIINNSITAEWKKNVITFVIPSKILTLSLINHQLSEVSAHFFLLHKKKRRIISTQFKFQNLATLEFTEQTIYIKFPIFLNICYYKLMYKDSEMKYLEYYSIIEDKFPIVIDGKFIINNTLNIKLLQKNQEYWIIFIEVELVEDDELFYYSHYFEIKFRSQVNAQHEQTTLNKQISNTTNRINTRKELKNDAILIISVSSISLLFFIILVKTLIILKKRHMIKISNLKDNQIFKLPTSESNKKKSPLKIRLEIKI